MPNYRHYYNQLEGSLDLHGSTTTFSGLCYVIAQALGALAQDTVSAVQPGVLLSTGAVGVCMLLVGAAMTSKTAGAGELATHGMAWVLLVVDEGCLQSGRCTHTMLGTNG